MGDVHYLPRHSAPPACEPKTQWVDDDPDWRWPDRLMSPGRMILPISELVDWPDIDVLERGKTVLVSDTGLTRAAVVVEVRDGQTVTVDIT